MAELAQSVLAQASPFLVVVFFVSFLHVYHDVALRLLPMQLPGALVLRTPQE
jgi:hypothetical protein